MKNMWVFPNYFTRKTSWKIQINDRLTWFWDPPTLDLVLLNTGSVPVMTKPNSWGHEENTENNEAYNTF